MLVKSRPQYHEGQSCYTWGTVWSYCISGAQRCICLCSYVWAAFFHKEEKNKKNKKSAEDNIHHLKCAKRLWIGWDKTGDCADNQLPGWAPCPGPALFISIDFASGTELTNSAKGQASGPSNCLCTSSCLHNQQYGWCFWYSDAWLQGLLSACRTRGMAGVLIHFYHASITPWVQPYPDLIPDLSASLWLCSRPCYSRTGWH